MHICLCQRLNVSDFSSIFCYMQRCSIAWYDCIKQLHICGVGLSDDPKELPVFVASNEAAVGCSIKPLGDNIFAAVWYCRHTLLFFAIPNICAVEPSACRPFRVSILQEIWFDQVSGITSEIYRDLSC